MLLKRCTQYVSKFGKSSHRTGKGQFSFQSQRREMPKNVQTTIRLSSFHMLSRLCSKSFKLGFRSTWIEMYKLGLEKTEIKLPTFTGSKRKQGHSRKASTSASNEAISFIAKVFDCVDDNKLENSLRERNTTPPYLSPEKLVWGSRSSS